MNGNSLDSLAEVMTDVLFHSATSESISKRNLMSLNLFSLISWSCICTLQSSWGLDAVATITITNKTSYSFNCDGKRPNDCIQAVIERKSAFLKIALWKLLSNCPFSGMVINLMQITPFQPPKSSINDFFESIESIGKKLWEGLREFITGKACRYFYMNYFGPMFH